MSDYYSIQELGGDRLAKAYPDRGVISESPWARAVLTVAAESKRFWGLFGKSERFIAVLSGNAEGLRVFVALDNFTMFVPWSEVTVVAAERTTPATVVRLRTRAAPKVSLELHLDDVAADRLFQGVTPALPRREPPGRLRWPRPAAVAALVAITIVIGLSLGLLHLDAVTLTIANVVVATVLAIIWFACRPLMEEKS
jgi:hypothetical protein